MSSNADKILQILAQLRPPGTDPEIIFRTKNNQQVITKKLYVANLTTQNRKFSVFIDNDGVTFDESTALVWEAGILKNTTEVIELDIPVRNNAAALAIQTDFGNALNFTLTGLR